MWNGITQRGICYKTGKLTRSACVCGVFVNHITEKKQCNNKMPAPGWTTLAKDSYAAFIEEQEGKKGITDWFRSGKRFPYWTNDKTNGQYCALGWLPYVQCGRSGLKITTCSKDQTCKCEIGCPGPAVLHPTLRWQPLCFTRGMNRCVCALVSTDIKSTEGCTMPTRVEENSMVYFTAKDSKRGKAPSWWDHQHRR